MGSIILGQAGGEMGSSARTDPWENNRKGFEIEKELVLCAARNWREENRGPGNFILKP